MTTKKGERGQALILIVFGLIVLVGFTGLAVDGGMAYLNRRNAQNAADSAALAGALAFGRSQDVNSTILGSTLANGFNNDSTTNEVKITMAEAPSGDCEGSASGEDITVQITAHVKTTFAPIIGITETTNRVSATARLCGTYVAPMFDGNAIVALSPSGTDFSGTGNPHWNINGGGIFVNSNSSAAATCGGAASVIAPSVTSAGGTSFTCSTPPLAGSITTNAPAYKWADYKNQLPPLKPSNCTGNAMLISGTWYPQSGAVGSNVALSGDMNFAPGVYCVTNSPGPYHGLITGSGVTFYVLPSDFNIKFSGGGGNGGMFASAPTSGPLSGLLMYVQPQVDGSGNLINTQAIDLRGNGNAGIVGSVIAPSADVTMYGNSGTSGDDTQVVGYTVVSGGGATINVNFHAEDNWQAVQNMNVTLMK